MIETNICTGCSACSSICPTSSITMKYDEEGFLKPNVDKKLCNNCGLCFKVCPVIKSQYKKQVQNAYMCFNKNDKERLGSSSGGVFIKLAQEIINCNGTVYGASFSKDMYSVHHIGINNKEELYKLQGSKYLQSDINNCFINIKNKLDNGEKVLFSGTPCQVAGLKNYLNKEYNNLILMDFVCHGVPSTLVWAKYLKSIENKFCSKSKTVFFRDKSINWKKFSMKIVLENGKIHKKRHSEDLYFRGFLSNITLNKACYECKFKGIKRAADITLADFWGIDKIFPEIDSEKGVSLICVNSIKGHTLLKQIDDFIVCKAVDVDVAFNYNKAAIESVEKSKWRDGFMAKLNDWPIEKLLKKYCGIKLKERIKMFIKKMVK